MDGWEIAAGSVIGKDHVSSGKVLIGRNNQDAYAVRRAEDAIVAVVCDGCGSGKHSEVGAWFGANAVASAVSQYKWSPGSQLEMVRQDVLANIRMQARMMGGSFSRTVNDYFLFTTFLLYMDRTWTYMYSIGDGVYGGTSRSGDARPVVHNIGPFANNTPPYLGYALVESSIKPDLLEFKCQGAWYTSEVEAVFIGSDGVGDLEKAEGRLIPGTSEEVGPISELWDRDEHFSNPEALGRRLRRMNSEIVRFDRETGRKFVCPRLLPDDTTVVVVRRKP